MSISNVPLIIFKVKIVLIIMNQVDFIIMTLCVILSIGLMIYINKTSLSLFCKNKCSRYKKDDYTIYKEELKNNSFEENVLIINQKVVNSKPDNELL
jgi:hypothetical protein